MIQNLNNGLITEKNLFAMIALVFIYFLFLVNLFAILMETKTNFYKNSRFWTIFIAFAILIGMTGMSIYQ